jgi:hypothetical protein
MEKLEITETPEHVLLCKKCKTKVRAGASWWLFCPRCLSVENGAGVIDMIMSCIHCRKPLVIEKTEDGRTVGRCYTENCGDCYSMQDLCLISLPEKIGLKKKEPEPETIWSVPITRGRKIPKRPTLDQLDASGY